MQIEKGDINQLKQFALTMSWAFPAVFSLLLPWLFNFSYQYWPLAITAILLALWLFKPAWIFYPYKVWMTIGGLIGWVNTRIILAACFYLLIFPIGVLMKWLGKLDYQDKIDKNKQSNYRLIKDKSDKKNLEFPF